MQRFGERARAEATASSRAKTASLAMVRSPASCVSRTAPVDGPSIDVPMPGAAPAAGKEGGSDGAPQTGAPGKGYGPGATTSSWPAIRRSSTARRKTSRPQASIAAKVLLRPR